MYGTIKHIIRTIRCQSLLTPHKLCLCLLLFVIHSQLSAQEIVQAHHKGNIKGYEISRIDSIITCQIEEV